MQLKDLTMSFGTQELFTNINLHIGENEKVGIIGVNGSGKTTLFKIILGLIVPDSGKVILENNSRVAYLPQIIDDEILNSEVTVLDYLLSGRPIKKLENELQKTYKLVCEETDEIKLKTLFKRIDKLEKQLDYWNQYSYETILLKIIDGMCINVELLEKQLKTLSGGQKSKISFAKLLYSKPEVILLDEPTNHLDQESKSYIINYLKNYSGNVYIISHDIDFLNQVTTKTLYIDKRTKTFQLYNGNYNYFKKLNLEYEKNLERQIEIQKKEEEKLKTIVNLYSNSSGNRKRMAQDREKKLEKLLENKIDVEEVQKQTKFEIKIIRESNSIPLRIQNLCFKYNEKSNKNIINNLTFSLNKGEKFLIIGENGIGKSTLLKLIVGVLSPNSGKIEIGNKTDIGYYAQEHELLDNNKSIIDNFNDLKISQKQLRNVLGRFLFFGNDVFKKINNLSPGERSRVALAKLSLKGTNFLILDEPTNHLDPQTQIIIAETFKTFSGTMLLVSHNLDFVDNLGIERTLFLPSGKIEYYNRETVRHFEIINKK